MAQNKNGPIIGMSIFGLLSVMFAVFWYMSHSHNQQIQAQLAAAANDKQKDQGTINDQIQQLNLLKDLAGYGPGDDVGHGDPNAEGSIAKEVRDLIGNKAGDNTNVPPNLTGALLRTAAERDNHNFTSDQRLQMYNQKVADLQNDVKAKDEEIARQKAARDAAESSLVAREAEHSKQMEALEQQNDSLRQEKAQMEQDLQLQITGLQVELRDLDEAINGRDGNGGYRNTIQSLQNRLRGLEDFSFFEPDGMIASVDHQQQLVYTNLGADDGLRVGMSFSVYARNNSGVGKAATSDIKGKIVIVKLLGGSRSEARIVDEKQGDPIAPEDPIFSPLFQSGQAMEIVVVGQINTDGLSRGRFHSLVKDHGASIAVEIDDQGNFSDGRGNVLTEEDAKRRITSRVRFIVKGDYGDENTQNPALEKLFGDIRKNSEALIEDAEQLGIYPIGMGAFLEHIGYARQQASWTPNSSTGYPARLTNGARSAIVNGSIGNRESSTPVTGLYGGRRSPTSVSTGQVSKAYSN